MPWNAITDEQLKVVFLAISGHITADDIGRMHSDFRDWFAGRGFVLFVHIESATLAIGPEAIRKLAALEPVFNKMAFYAAKRPRREFASHTPRRRRY